MSIDITRSIHPDLLEEYLEAVPEQAPAVRQRQKRKKGAAAQEASPAAAGEQELGAATEVAGESAAPPEPSAPPEWMTALEAANDPVEKMALLLKNVPREEMEKSDVIRGWLGDAANQRARRMLEDQERQRVERARQEAYDKGDLYTLGQLQAQELQQQRNQLQAQAEIDANPYLVQVRAFQASMPEEVQREVQGKRYDSFGAYLTAVQQAAIRHGIETEISKRAEGLHRAALSQTVGMEQSPELDGGPAQAYREITDAQVAAMDLEEYDRHFDEKGRPRPGVRVRLERGIDLRRR